MTTWDEEVGMWRVEVVNQHGDVLVRWFRSWHRAERYRMHVELKPGAPWEPERGGN